MTEPESAPWRYLLNNAASEPQTLEDMRRLIETGAVGPRTMVWREGMEKWQFAERTELAAIARPAPPPPPPVSPSPAPTPKPPQASPPKPVAPRRPVRFAAFEPFGKYATFSGRADRAEFSQFLALQAVLGLLVQGAGASGNAELLVALLFLLVVSAVPYLAVLVRRLHDVGKSGKNFWWLIVPFVQVWWAFVILFEPGNAEANAYGPPPGPKPSSGQGAPPTGAPAETATPAQTPSPIADEAPRPSAGPTFNIILLAKGEYEIEVIKALRSLDSKLTLPAARKLSAKPMAVVLTGLTANQANEAKATLQAAGADVEVAVD